MGDKDYSGTPLWKKLGIREGSRVSLVGAAKGFDRALGRLPEGTSVRSAARRPSDVIVFFATSRAVVARRFGSLARALDPAGGLWVAYPKKASGVPTDLTFENVQKVGLDAGLVDNKSCAIDEIWSAVRFVMRLADRKGR